MQTEHSISIIWKKGYQKNLKQTINIMSVFLIGFLFLMCNTQKKTAISKSSKSSCSYCDNFLNQYFIDYPYRQVDKNLHGTELPVKDKSGLSVKDSFLVLTEFEQQMVADNLFCFLGKNFDFVDNCFHPRFSRYELPTGIDSTKTMIYNYNIGNYMTGSKSDYQPIENIESDTIFEFWLIGGGNFWLEFTKKNNEFVYTGNFQDTLRMNDCIKQ